jgi:hypothetical protein
MSPLQTIDVGQTADRKLPAFRASGVIDSDVTELAQYGEDVLIRKAPDDARMRPAPAAQDQVITQYTDSEKWCGDRCTKYAVLRVEATTFALAVICGVLALVLLGVMFPDAFAFMDP